MAQKEPVLDPSAMAGPKEKKRNRDQYDSPWKEIIGRYFVDFLAFFFPQAYAEIDWARSYETLDKELHQIVRDARLGKRLADKLFKVWLKNGLEEFVLIHAEVQGRGEGAFAERMFVYNYRVFDIYRGRTGSPPVVASLAILADDSATWQESKFEYGCWGSKMSFEFATVKLRDYNERWAELEKSTNIFAPVTMAYLKARETRKDPEKRLFWKTRLIRRLYVWELDRQRILDLFLFIDWVMSLPEELEQKFWDDHLAYEAEQTMRYVTSVERIGIKKGKKQGLEEGRKEGRKEGLVSLVKNLIRHRFSEVPSWAEARLIEASPEDLETWGTRLLEAQSLEEVFVTV